MLKEFSPKFPQVKVSLKKTNGSKDDIIAYVSNKMIGKSVPISDVYEYDNLARSGDFAGLLVLTMNYVTLTDDDSDSDSTRVIEVGMIEPLVQSLYYECFQHQLPAANKMKEIENLVILLKESLEREHYVVLDNVVNLQQKY